MTSHIDILRCCVNGGIANCSFLSQVVSLGVGTERHSLFLGLSLLSIGWAPQEARV